jgi:hypothetical protein
VRALIFEQTDTATLVAEQHEGLPEDANGHGRVFVGKLLGYGYRVPVTAEELSAWGAGPYPNEGFILFSG